MSLQVIYQRQRM